MTNLWHQNTPNNFWLCHPDPPEEAWLQAYRAAFPVLGLSHQVDDIDTAISLTLGEGQFGSGQWKISPAKRLYYALKPALPRSLRYALRRQYKQYSQSIFQLRWPIEDRYVRFQFEVARQLMIVLGQPYLSFRYFWSQGYRYAVVLTHDVETCDGQAYVQKVADMEEQLGFRSSFNFVPECYELNFRLMQELCERGFEVGVHGLKHDGKLFNSQHGFMQCAERINYYIKEFGAVGFRSPLMMRNPDWMQALQVEYDLSFFDTDPHQPMPGGCMSIWPFFLGRFVELPYTLDQDCTLGYVLGEKTPRLWLEKLEFIERNYGLALINTHPDYLKDQQIWEIYINFLNAIADRDNYWHALPKEVARWWRRRAEIPMGQEPADMILGTLLLKKDRLAISLPGDKAVENMLVEDMME
jgi:peptidoglycan/xylan/chitin deacetylase (PgdA/CDA1 family)